MTSFQKKKNRTGRWTDVLTAQFYQIGNSFLDNLRQI